MEENKTPQNQHHHHHNLPPTPTATPTPTPTEEEEVVVVQQVHTPVPSLPPPHNKLEMNKAAVAAAPYTSSGSKRALCTCLTVFLLVAGITLLALWLVYRPHKPHFTVVGAAIYSLNTTTTPAPLLSSTLQFNALIRNPNKRVSVYCDKFSAFVSYRNQAITPQVMLPPLFLEKHSQVSLSPVIGGGGTPPVPVSVEVSNGLLVDEGYGVVGLKLVFLGRLRWKLAGSTIKTGHYGFYVHCDLLIAFKKGFVGQVPLLGSTPCNVHT